MLNHKATIAFHWLCGFMLSVLTIWLVGGFALPLIDLWEQSGPLGTEIHAPGTFQTDRNEGWGKTQFNIYGAQGLETIPPGFDPHICFFGDSYVQGGQIPLKKHFYNLYNQAVEDERYAIAYGFSGRDCPIYFELMESIPKVFPEIDTYVLFLGVDDILPNKSSQQFDPPVFTYKARPRPLNKYRKRLYEIRANSAWTFLKICKESLDELRIQPGPVHHKKSSRQQPDNHDLEEMYVVFWKELINTALAASNDRHLRIAIKETVPRVESGKIMRTIKEGQVLDKFIQIASDMDVEVIDMREQFLQHYDQTGEFPKGSSFTYPGEGHWNQVGHQMIADQIQPYISKRDVKSKDSTVSGN